MGHKGVGYFNAKGHFFKTPEEATMSDLSSLLGKIGDGDGESLAPGIAYLILEKRAEIEAIFAEHDEMLAEHAERVADAEDNVTPIDRAKGEK
ncbi:hypothetical protein [Erythrobacter sp. HKB08]|uniref:hypothetical protein n=1 Tax=Erythrobacter sp. HKB08 TaxID=2502843 RepID=UPI001008BC5D|nr:hypothetical protein [Erythrobacter sp. HKB08]